MIKQAYWVTIANLKTDCYALIDQISRKPYGLKLLLSAKKALEMFSQYKGTRAIQRGRNGKQSD